MLTDVQTRRSRSPWIALVAILVVLSSSCSLFETPLNLPDDVRARVESTTAALDSTEDVIEERQNRFNDLLDSEDFAFAADYTPEELHEDRFDQAEAELEEAKQYFDENAKPLMEDFEDSEEGREDLFDELDTTTNMAASASGASSAAVDWLDSLAHVHDNPERASNEAQAAALAVTEAYEALEEDVNRTKGEFPDQVEEIETRLGSFTSTKNDAVAAAEDINTLAANPEPDIPQMTELYVTATAAAEKFPEEADSLRSAIADLDVSETRTLVDVRVDSVVLIDRTTWNESDYGEDDFEYPDFPVSQEAAAHFAQFAVGQKLAHAEKNDGNDIELEPGVDPTFWTELGLSESTENWPGSDDHAEYYFGGLEDTYCDQLLVIRNGEPSTEGRPDTEGNYCSAYDTEANLAEGRYWVEADYYRGEYIGMDLYAKGYGQFADEATDGAMPPGIVYVDNPDTGEWREDSNGNSYWHYYGQYRFYSDLIGGSTPYHYRGEYDEWRSSYRGGSRAYNPTVNGSPRYGASSPLATTRFAGTNFNSSGLQDATVRGAGPAARGGGPGGGGK